MRKKRTKYLGVIFHIDEKQFSCENKKKNDKDRQAMDNDETDDMHILWEEYEA